MTQQTTRRTLIKSYFLLENIITNITAFLNKEFCLRRRIALIASVTHNCYTKGSF